MGLNKAERVAIIITAAFILLSAGYYIGLACIGSDYNVAIEKHPDEQAVQQGGDSPTPVASSAEITEKIDINTASAEELITLPGIGEVLAERIIAYREKNGKFENIESIMDIQGIGEGTFLKIMDMITV